jgi:asparagine synthase (glutamine-hydrolysing)
MAGISGILETSMISGNDWLLRLVNHMAGQTPGAERLRIEATADETSGLTLAAAGVPAADDPARLTALARTTSGRYTIALTGTNGPFRSIRRALDRMDDARPSAALLATAVEDLGVARVLQLVDGPLALAVWDRAERTLTLGRDRYGQETLFAGWAGSSFLFASHLFSLAAHPGFSREIDRGAAAQFLRYSHFQSPNTIFRSAIRVLPGGVITIRADRPGADITQECVASIRDDAQAGLQHRFTGSRQAATDALDAAVRSAFHDATTDPSTPIGVFFSGGLDSTLLAATAAAMGERPVHAITAGFHEAAYDEASHAAEIARHLGLKHHIIRVTADDMLDLLPKAAHIFQEPLGDIAALPAIKLAEATRDLVPLIVTGDGGDELFMGRPSNALWEARRFFPGPLRPLTAHALDLLAAGADRAGGVINRAVPGVLARYLRPSRIRKAAAGMHAITAETGMGALYSETLDPREFIAHPRQEPVSYYDDTRQWLDTPDQDERWRFIGTLGYTIDREIPKHQRAITAAGLAFRSMLVHPEIVNLTWSLSPETRDPGGVSRGLMRDVIMRNVPESVFDKPKAGFDVPFDRWFRGPLRPMIEELLSPKRLEAQGIFNPGPIRREWSQHVSGKYDRRYILFDLLMIQLWLESLNRVPGSLYSENINPSQMS